MFESKFVKMNPVTPRGRGRHLLESFNLNEIENMVDDFFGNEKELEYKDSRYGIKKMLMEDLGVKVRGDIPVNIYKPKENDEENKEVYNIEFLIPGVNKEDIKVSLKNEDELQVKVEGKECKCGEKCENDEKCEDCKDERYYVMEFNNSDMGMKSNVIFFERKSEFESSKRKSHINKDKIQTKYSNGILNVKIELGMKDDISNIEIE